MQKFELGFALRGTTVPEVKQIVEAGSMREAIYKIVGQYGGTEWSWSPKLIIFRSQKRMRGVA